MKQNWEQNVEIGSNMLCKPVHHTRIHMTNPNGISLANNSLKYKMLYKAGMENSTDNMGCNECNPGKHHCTGCRTRVRSIWTMGSD
eukprot:7555118-Ditylum_brightwellii.AAC.1